MGHDAYVTNNVTREQAQELSGSNTPDVLFAIVSSGQKSPPFRLEPLSPGETVENIEGIVLNHDGGTITPEDQVILIASGINAAPQAIISVNEDNQYIVSWDGVATRGAIAANAQRAVNGEPSKKYHNFMSVGELQVEEPELFSAISNHPKAVESLRASLLNEAAHLAIMPEQESLAAQIPSMQLPLDDVSVSETDQVIGQMSAPDIAAVQPNNGISIV
jgi:hypothetical protein